MPTSRQIQPIPKNAKKVFDGVIFDVYQWQQKLYDGSVSTFEKVRRPDTVEAICTVGNKIIVLENGQPGREIMLGLPAGRMDRKGESPTDCIKREKRAIKQEKYDYGRSTIHSLKSIGRYLFL